MRHMTSTSRSDSHSVAIATQDQQLFVRGLTNGVFLSMAIWLAAAYLTLALR